LKAKGRSSCFHFIGNRSNFSGRVVKLKVALPGNQNNQKTFGAKCSIRSTSKKPDGIGSGYGQP
jgi:hypothetical protein